jgi:hypothetical protein
MRTSVRTTGKTYSTGRMEWQFQPVVEALPWISKGSDEVGQGRENGRT